MTVLLIASSGSSISPISLSSVSLTAASAGSWLALGWTAPKLLLIDDDLFSAVGCCDGDAGDVSDVGNAIGFALFVVLYSLRWPVPLAPSNRGGVSTFGRLAGAAEAVPALFDVAATPVGTVAGCVGGDGTDDDGAGGAG